MPKPNFYTHNGKTQHITDWASELGLSFGALYSRLDRGWTFDRAISQAPRKWASLHDRFLDAITYEPNSGCWLWCGYTSKAGYGQLGRGPGSIYAHRYAYEHFKGEIPAGLHILHSCDQPACCNPDHLRVGTQAENMSDMAKRCRSGRMKLTHEAKADIATRRLSADEFATLYDVHKKTVQKIMRGRYF